jgi:hypothetical protein
LKNLKDNEKEDNKNLDQKWEELLRKEESQIRMYISNENYLKIKIELQREKIEDLEIENKLLSSKIEKLENLKKKLNIYKSKIELLNKLIKQYEKKIKAFLENKTKIFNNNQKEEGIEYQIEEDKTKISDFSKKDSISRDYKNINLIINKKNKNQKKQNKTHTMNDNSISRKPDSLSKTKKNEEARNSIDIDKYNYSTIFVNKNYSFYDFSLKNSGHKNKLEETSSKKYRILNNSQVFQNVNINNKIHIYKKIINQKIKNISRSRRKNGLKSHKNDCLFLVSMRDIKKGSNHSLDTKVYSTYQKNQKKSVDNIHADKGISIKVIHGRNKNQINTKNENSYFTNKLLNKNFSGFYSKYWVKNSNKRNHISYNRRSLSKNTSGTSLKKISLNDSTKNKLGKKK